MRGERTGEGMEGKRRERKGKEEKRKIFTTHLPRAKSNLFGQSTVLPFRVLPLYEDL